MIRTADPSQKINSIAANAAREFGDVSQFAAGTIGRSTAQALAKAGAKVVLADIDREMAASIARSLGGAERIVHFDGLVPESIEALTVRAMDWLGGLDVLVQNAGVQVSGRG